MSEHLDRERRRAREQREDEERWTRYVLTGEAVPHEHVREWLDALSQGLDAPRPS